MIQLSQIIILNVPKREREGKYLKKLIETSTKPYGIQSAEAMALGQLFQSVDTRSRRHTSHVIHDYNL